jgi:hypothetical protein
VESFGFFQIFYLLVLQHFDDSFLLNELTPFEKIFCLHLNILNNMHRTSLIYISRRSLNSSYIFSSILVLSSKKACLCIFAKAPLRNFPFKKLSTFSMQTIFLISPLMVRFHSRSPPFLSLV